MGTVIKFVIIIEVEDDEDNPVSDEECEKVLSDIKKLAAKRNFSIYNQNYVRIA